MKLLSQLVVPVLEKPPKFQPNSPEQFAVRLYCQFLSKAACLKKSDAKILKHLGPKLGETR